MPRYFIQVSYLGKGYAGFQIQENAKTIQGELEQVLMIVLKDKIGLTGSSRTDADVNALQNFFHFDHSSELSPKLSYNLNALLPASIAVKAIHRVGDTAHARFDAIAREYCYDLHFRKNPFLNDRSLYYPYPLDLTSLNLAAQMLLENCDFSSFCKKGSQAKTRICKLEYSRWEETEQGLKYQVKGNRFLRGMVRGMVGTMLKFGRGKSSLNEFAEVIAAKDSAKADFAVPGHGLTLMEVSFPYVLEESPPIQK